jgi:hypothetical protein
MDDDAVHNMGSSDTFVDIGMNAMVAAAIAGFTSDQINHIINRAQTVIVSNGQSVSETGKGSSSEAEEDTSTQQNNMRCTNRESNQQVSPSRLYFDKEKFKVSDVVGTDVEQVYKDMEVAQQLHEVINGSDESSMMDNEPVMPSLTVKEPSTREVPLKSKSSKGIDARVRN